MGIAEYVVRELMREFTSKTREFYEFVMPPVDIYEDGSDLVVVADMPGFKKEDIVIRVSGNILSVRATRERVEPTGIVYWKQRPLKIDKKIPLPFSVAEEDVKATYKEGLLEIRVPLKGAVKIE
ncbi:MAG: archaeal heat shock protein Hsp14 [Candidatus Nitrosocaldus sp.]